MDKSSSRNHRGKLKSTYTNSAFYTLYTTLNSLYITSQFHPTHMIIICRKTGKISFKSRKLLTKLLSSSSKKAFTTLPVFCIFGMIDILGRRILLLVTSVSVAAHFRNRPILKIEEVKGKIVIKAKEPGESEEQMKKIMDYIRRYMKKGFYFSHFYDLSTKFPWSLFQHGKDPSRKFPQEPRAEDVFYYQDAEAGAGREGSGEL